MNNLKMLQEMFPNQIMIKPIQMYKLLDIGQTKFYELLKQQQFDELPKISYINGRMRFYLADIAEFMTNNGIGK